MAKLYICIVCQHANASITDLHNHHIQHHSPEELSHTIINLQGLKFIEKECLKSITLGDSNNNKNLYDRVIVNAGKQNSHDKTYCLSNCSQFIVWEHELNKRTEICDNDFFNIIENLCTDLSKKTQRGRKKRNEAIINKIKTESFVHHNENKNNIESSKTIEKFNNDSPQISTVTTSSWNIENPFTNTADNDEILKTQIKGEMITDNSVIAPMTLIETDTNKNVLMYNPPDDSFSSSSIITIDTNGKEISTTEKNAIFIPQ